MDRIYIEIIAILILIAANGFFSLSEFALIASRKSRLKRLASDGSRAAARALKIHNRPETFLATVQVGITFVAMLAGVFSGATIVNRVIPLIREIPVTFISASARPLSYIIVAVVISFFSVVLGELVPKYIALSKPNRISISVSGMISIFITIGSLPVKLLTGTARLIIRMMGIRRPATAGQINEDEINILISEGREKGIFDETEEELIHSVFDFADTNVRQAMTPRTDIVGIDVNSETGEILRTVSSYGFSRFPVYEGTMDKIVGVIYAKDILRVLQHTDLIIMNDIIRKPLFVPDSMPLSNLLRTFQQKRVHMATVLDEFGGTAGIITMEDLLEEIVGEIQDEFDTGQKEYVEKSKSLAFAAGSLRVDELNDEFSTKLPEDGPDTIGGLVFERLGRPGLKGDEVIIDNIKFKVLEVEGTRMKRFRIEKLPQKEKLQ